MPTLKELGHGIVAISPWGLGGPCGLPPAVLDRLHQGFHAAMHESAYLAELAKVDQELAYLGPAAYANALRAGYRNEQQFVERLGLANS